MAKKQGNHPRLCFCLLFQTFWLFFCQSFSTSKLISTSRNRHVIKVVSIIKTRYKLKLILKCFQVHLITMTLWIVCFCNCLSEQPFCQQCYSITIHSIGSCFKILGLIQRKHCLFCFFDIISHCRFANSNCYCNSVPIQ